MRRRELASRLDPILGGSALLLVAIGILFIYSSNVTAEGAIVSRETLKQIIWAVLGVGVLVFLAFFGYGRLRAISLYIYGGNLLLLVITLVFGQT